MRHLSPIAVAVGTVCLLGASGCNFDSGVGTDGCSPAGAKRNGEMCVDGSWVPYDTSADAPDGGTDTGEPTADTVASDARPPTDTVASDADPGDAIDSTVAPDGGDVDTGPGPDTADSTAPPTDTTDTTAPADTTDTAVPPDTTDTSVPSDTSDTFVPPDTADTTDGDGGPSCPGSAGCPCNFNTLTDGVCGSATTDSNGDCRRPSNFEYAESSCGDGVDNDCDGDTDSSDPDCSGKPPASNCTSASACTSGLCVKEPPPTAGPPDRLCAHRIFVTSKKWNGDLGGTSGADTKCKRLANRAKLNGNWRAVVSTSSSDAHTRISLGLDEPVHNLKPNSHQRVFEGSGEMWGLNDPLHNAIEYDETGGSTSGGAWTGTGNLGFVSRNGTTPETCSGWQSSASSDNGAYGNPQSTHDVHWVRRGTHGCNTTLRLYCIDGQ